MQWWVASGLMLLWAVLQLVAPRSWTPMLLIGGLAVLIVQITAYRKTRQHR